MDNLSTPCKKAYHSSFKHITGRCKHFVKQPHRHAIVQSQTPRQTNFISISFLCGEITNKATALQIWFYYQKKNAKTLLIQKKLDINLPIRFLFFHLTKFGWNSGTNFRTNPANPVLAEFSNPKSGAPLDETHEH